MYGKDVKIKISLLDQDTASYIASFDCDNNNINNYYRYNANNDISSVTHLFIDENMNRLVACATLSTSGITIVPDLFTTDMPTTLIPAYEVKYFAVDKAYQHLKYNEDDSETLSYYIFSYILMYLENIAATQVGATKIVLYSVPKAMHFYERSGFRRLGHNLRGDDGDYVKDCIAMYIDIERPE